MIVNFLESFDGVIFLTMQLKCDIHVEKVSHVRWNSLSIMNETKFSTLKTVKQVKGTIKIFFHTIEI